MKQGVRKWLVGRSGFTLIELLIVMVIIGLLASLVAPKLFKKVGGAKQKTAQAQIALLGTALDSFRLDNDQYPSTEEGLEALRRKPESRDRWDGPYLPKDIPHDPWGNSYAYKCPGDHGEYDLSSYGADGQAGGDGDNQDINSWE
ncbi:MAG: type II secretion system major pseudopilin GspG [Deltaproteobacteria bacterium]|nr:type II secretion system major pseudopilin GspG [Candidatus Anaeroferrophillus wilburensis]MBN2888369.1 type II secretion system major pseudopilin GspG [Deltaproteobacteria bacterium]